MRNKLLLAGTLSSVLFMTGCSNNEDVLSGTSEKQAFASTRNSEHSEPATLEAGKTIITFYWIFDPRIKADWGEEVGTEVINIIVPKSRGISDTLHYTINKQIYDRYEMEGSGFFFPTDPNNPEGSEYWVINLEDDTKNLFEKLDKKKYPWGSDGQGNPLKPWKSAAVDEDAIPLNSKVYIPFLDNLELPDPSNPGSTFQHNGMLNGSDKSWSFDSYNYTGAWVDVFAGTYNDFLAAEHALNEKPWHNFRNDLVSKESGELEEQWACSYFIKPAFRMWDDSKTFKQGTLVANGSERYQAVTNVSKFKQLDEPKYWMPLSRE